jgi:hypothetical protein
MFAPADVTEAKRQGQGIGDVEAMRQMAVTAVPEILRNLPGTSTPMSALDAALAAGRKDYPGAAMAALGAVPFAGALKYADEARDAARAVRSALPMDDASRVARATEQGFEQGYYKGVYPYDWRTGKEIDVIQRPSPFPTFDPSEPPYEGIAGFLTKDPEVANRFATGTGTEGAVMPLAYRPGKTLTIDAKGKPAGALQFGESGKPFRDAVRSGQYETIVLKNTKDEGDVTVALRPENIRSRFAKFDPANIGKAGLMGGLAAVLAGQRNQEQRDEP